MTATAETALPLARPRARADRWVHDWRPEDEAFWAATGEQIARRNLIFSVLSEHIGFSVWTMWSVLVLFLGPAYGFTPPDKFLLTAVPTLVGAVLRLPYTFAVTRFGGRNWTVITALALVVPLALMLLVLHPGVSLRTLLIVSAVAGIGGGNFASSMTNINAFYPERRKGWALGINAGAGNLGVPSVQLVGLAVLAAVGAGHPRVLVSLYVPLVLGSAALAWRSMDNLVGARSDRCAMRDACRRSHTWVLSFLYIGSFGSFIGFGFAFGQVLRVQFPAQFPTPIDAAYLTFLGPLLGSLVRPYGGHLADRFGGARVTMLSFVAMAGGGALVLLASLADSLTLFLVAFTVLFLLAGVSNGSTYKMIPAVFRASAASESEARRLSGAVIGIAGAMGGLGGVAVNVAFRESFLRTGTGNAAYVGFLACYAMSVAVTYAVYLRPSRRLPGV
jgi:NNP family nitrate/nitrite transporter-like MFS transporter